MGNITKQEIFDRVATHLLTQGEAATDNGVCQYRYNGLSCAVGCLIKDEFYHQGLEGRFADDERVLSAVAKSIDCDPEYVMSNLRVMLENLQGIHDTNDPDEWPGMLEDLAEHFNLEWNHG